MAESWKCVCGRDVQEVSETCLYCGRFFRESNRERDRRRFEAAKDFMAAAMQEAGLVDEDTDLAKEGPAIERTCRACKIIADALLARLEKRDGE